jgi:polysaccharide export outer membrane protein
MRSNSYTTTLTRPRAVAAALSALVLAFACLGGAAAQSPRPQQGGPMPGGQNMAAQPPSQPGGPPPGVSQSPDYRLGSGDRVRITVFGQQDLTGEYLVDGTGMLAFPLIGRVPAGNATAAELAQTIAKRLEPDYVRNPNISIEVLTYRPFYIVGEVKQPGSYPYVSGMSVINAIALAGGFTYRARESSFYLTRANKDGSKARVEAAPETPVQPGDVITVRERYF